MPGNKEYKYHLMVGLYSCLSIIEEKPHGVGEAIYNTQRQIIKDWGFSERDAWEITISALDTYTIKIDQLRLCFFYPPSLFKHFAMTTGTHDQDLAS